VTGGRSDVALRAAILLRGIRSRPASAVMLFAASTVAVAAAAIGPIFLAAADRSVLSTTFASAAPGESAVKILATGGPRTFARLEHASVDAVSTSHGLLERPVLSADVGTTFIGAGQQQYRGDLLARTAACAHLRLVRGRCPTRLGDVAVSERSAKASHIALGSTVRLGEATQTRTLAYTVVGVYRPPVSVQNAFWGGIDYFAFGTGSSVVEQLDPFLGSFATVLRFAPIAAPQVAADLVWTARAPFVGRSALASTLRRVQSRLSSDSSLRASTGLGAILAASAHDAHLMRTVVLAVVLQLVLLVLVILHALGRSAAAGRRPEAEFARRHGFPRRAIVALAVGEPAALIAAALPAGLLLAWIVVDVAGRSLFVGGTAVSLGIWSVVAALGACVGGILAVGLASFELWGRDAALSRKRSAVAELTLDAVAVALALAGLVALATHGSLGGAHTNALASFAPGLLALGVGAVGVRIVLFALRLAVARSGESPRIAWFLALRRLARGPLALRQVLPLAAAVTLALFAVGSFARAAANRSLLAHFSVGSARVVAVSTPPGLDLETAVRRADPSGRQAMAAVFYTSSSGNLLAVDSSRLASVATWPGTLGPSAAGLAERLAPPVARPVVLRGSALRLRVSVPAGTPNLTLGVDVYDETYGGRTTLALGPVRAGEHAYAASLAGACPGLCRVLSLSPAWENPDEAFARTVRIRLAGGSERVDGVWREVRLGTGRSWRAAPSPAQVVRSEAGAVVFAVPGSLLGTGGILLSPASTAVRVPAVVTGKLEQLDPPSQPDESISLQDFDGNPLTVRAIAVVPTLPMLGTNGALVDLGLAERALTGPVVDSTEQVWLAKTASPAILSRLRSLGVTTGSTTSASTRLATLDRGGTALAYDLVLILSPVAALLALAAMTFEAVTAGRGRRLELRSLRLVGVPGRAVRRSLLLEQAVVLATALVVGAATGVAGLALALPSLPEFATGTGRLPIPKGVPGPSMLVAIASVAAVFAIAAACTTRIVAATRET